jgi:integrase
MTLTNFTPTANIFVAQLGEIRGGEAFDLLQLLNTGHSGTLSTIHASSAKQGQKIGALWLNWHTLRRTHATLLQAAGASPRDAQVQLGHSKMSTTLELYTVPIPAHLREAVENLSQLVTNGDEFGQIAEGVPTTIQ